HSSQISSFYKLIHHPHLFLQAQCFLQIDEDGELICRRMKSGLSVSNLIHEVSSGSLSMGTFEILIDFDEDGKVVSIELLS
ncbi:MAG: DUF2283 domain-containing protein, partial [Pseudomonadota bacterium]